MCIALKSPASCSHSPSNHQGDGNNSPRRLSISNMPSSSNSCGRSLLEQLSCCFQRPETSDDDDDADPTRRIASPYLSVPTVLRPRKSRIKMEVVILLQGKAAKSLSLFRPYFVSLVLAFLRNVKPVCFAMLFFVVGVKWFCSLYALINCLPFL